MSNLIRAELYRLRQRRLPVGLLVALLILLPLMMVVLVRLEIGNMVRVEAQPLTEALKYCLGVGVFFAIPCAALAFSGQYETGTLINEAVFGVPRLYMYLSRLAAAAVLGACLAAVCFGSALVFALLFLGPPLETLVAFWELLPWLAGALPIWIASAAVSLCFEFVFRADRTAIVLYFLYLIFGYLFIGSFAFAGQQVIAAGEANLLDYCILVAFILHPLTPFFPGSFLSQNVDRLVSPIYLDGTWIGAGGCWLLGLAVAALCAGLTWLVMRRRELR